MSERPQHPTENREGESPPESLRGWPKKSSTSCATSGGRCPTPPACTCSGTPTGGCCTWARRSRSASGSARISAARPRAARYEFLSKVDSIDFVVTQNEAEALLAEQRFIKQHRPPFNIRLRDDKSYPYIGISLEERFPRVYFTRERHRHRARLLRAVLERQARARDARPAGPAVPVPHVRRARAGPRCPAARASTTTSSAARPRASTTSARPTTAPTSRRSSASCPATTARSSESSTRG